MARKKETTKARDDEKPERAADDIAADRKLLERVRDRFTSMRDGDEHNRTAGVADLRFVHEPGAQWDDAMKASRGDRPCYEFNELRIKCKRIVNDMRANRPQAKVRGYEDTDKGTAEIIEGLGRNIWNCSDADTTIDNAGEYQVAAGFACWRVVTDYESDRSLDQDIYVEQIKNPFCLYWDEAAQDPIKRDARDWILTERIPKEEFESKYPNAEPVNFDTEREDDEDWGCEDGAEMVRIAEYWYKEPVEIELWQLANGMVIDSTRDPKAKELDPADPKQAIVKRRKVKAHNIMMTIVSGNAVLEKPKICAGSQHRFVVVFGESVVIDGKTYWFGLPRFSKDAQRNANITNTVAMESVVKFLQSPYWATADQVKGLLPQLKEAFQKGSPVALYNPDPKAPGPPQRTGGPELPVAMLELAEKSARLMDSTTGIYPPSVGGAQPGTRSGRAIIATQQSGEIATFNFQDNMAKSVMRTWEIFIDLIPQIYDTERTLRVLGADGAEDFVKVNSFVLAEDGTRQPLNDLSRGKYDVTVTVGPSFSTKRQEAVEIYGELFGKNPALQGIAGDLFFKAMDAPYSEEIAERFKLLLPKPIQDQMQQGKQVPPEVAQGMARVEQAAQAVQQQGALVQQAAAEVDQKKAEAEKAEAGVRTAIADLEKQRAQFDAQVAKAQAGIAQAEAQLLVKVTQAEAQQGTDALGKERENLAATVAQALQELHQLTAAFTQMATQAVQEIKAQPMMMPPKPKVREVRTRRVNGELVSSPVYEDMQPTLQ
jgi:hypothetical protein